MPNFRSARIPRMVVTEWPQPYASLKLDSERHHKEQPSGSAVIPPYTALYYTTAYTGEPWLIVYLYDTPQAQAA